MPTEFLRNASASGQHSFLRLRSSSRSRCLLGLCVEPDEGFGGLTESDGDFLWEAFGDDRLLAGLGSGAKEGGDGGRYVTGLGHLGEESERLV